MIEGLSHGDPGLYVLLVIVLALVSVMGLVVRSIIRGELVPRATVERLIVERDARIAAQASALEAATVLTAEQSHTISTQADSISDFGEAQRLNVRVAQALHAQVSVDAGGE